MYTDELPFTGVGSAVLTGAALLTTAVGAVLVTAPGWIAGALGSGAAVVTRLAHRTKLYQPRH